MNIKSEANVIPEGKGVYIWRLPDCGHGTDMMALAATLHSADVKWCSVKTHNGTSKTYDPPHIALIKAFVSACEFYGIKVRAWGYCYGLSTSHATQEATVAVETVQEYGMEGYEIDAEKEWKVPAAEQWAQAFGKRLRFMAPSLSVSLSTYRFPSLHHEFPFEQFLPYINFYLPQVYWEGSHNPATQLQKSFDEYMALKKLPYIPAGSVYCVGNWCASVSDVQAFHNKAKALNFQGISVWSLQHMIVGNQKPLWDLYKTLDWGKIDPPPLPPPVPTIPELPLAQNISGYHLRIRWTPVVAGDTNFTKKYVAPGELVPVSAIEFDLEGNEWWGVQSKEDVRGWSAKEYRGSIYLEWA